MSYCRYENTYQDLRDCYISMRDRDNDRNDELSKSEQRYKDQLIVLCQQICDYVENDSNGEYDELYD
jgi:hypothetical protein